MGFFVLQNEQKSRFSYREIPIGKKSGKSDIKMGTHPVATPAATDRSIGKKSGKFQIKSYILTYVIS